MQQKFALTSHLLCKARHSETQSPLRRFRCAPGASPGPLTPQPRTTPQVGVQAVAPAVLMVAYGSLLVDRVRAPTTPQHNRRRAARLIRSASPPQPAPTPQRSSLDADLGASGPSVVPSSLLRSLGGFLGFWLCLVWAGASSAALGLIRFGLLKN